jgi:hypothetical protein
MKTMIKLIAITYYVLSVICLSAFAQGTAFTYQGRLNDGANPATGLYDVRFSICDALANGNVVAGPLTNSATGISNGLFTVTLDFGGGVFTGSNRWVEIAARTNGAASFTTLSPRQPVQPVPYAIMANSASNLLGTLPAGQIVGALPPLQLGSGTANINISGSAATAVNGVVTTGSYADPSWITSLAGSKISGNISGNAANITGTLLASQLSGTLGLAQLPAGLITNGASGVNLSGNFTGNGAGLTNVNLMNINADGAITHGTNCTFVLATTLTGSRGINYVCAADVNGDGKVDLISAGDNMLTVLTNDGHGGFVISSSPGVGNAPLSVVAADVNGDGKVDLICANMNDGTLTVLTNDGSGGFVFSATLTVGSSPFSVVAADVNGDGQVDLICANGGDNTLTVLTNNGSGGFAANATLTVGNYPVSVVAADVNGDGKVDLISANDGDNTLTVLTNDGTGGFVISSSPQVGNGPFSVVAADVNGDGKVDLICANLMDNTLSVLTNDGSGGFVISSSPGVGSEPRSVVAVDVNGDGKMDLICANDHDHTLTVLLNDGIGGFVVSSLPVSVVGNHCSPVCAADVNGDGNPDLIVVAGGSSGAANTLAVFTNNASLTIAFTGNGAGLTNVTVSAAQLTSIGNAFGYSHGYNQGNFFVGPSGNSATSGIGNTGLGGGTLQTNTSGYGNTAVGFYALPANTSGSYNTANGFEALWNNASGSENIALGANAGYNTTGNNNIDIGNQGLSSDNNTIRIGDMQTNTFIAGVINGNGGGLTNLTVPAANLPAGILTNNASGVTLSGTFTGNGAGLTGLNAANLTGTVPLAQLSGLTGSQLSAAAWQLATNLNGGKAALASNVVAGIAITNAFITNSVFAGNGAGLASLNATNLASGTVPDARLSTNVALLNASQTFTGLNTFSKDDTSGWADAKQIIIQGSSDSRQQLELGYKTSGNYGAIQAIQQGVATTPLVLQPFGGRVGIGTTTPATMLEIPDSTGAGQNLRLTGPGGGTVKVGLDFATYNPSSFGSTNASARIEAHDDSWSADLNFLTKTPGNSTNALVSRLYIQNAGNVGIGTTTPATALQVNGTVTATSFSGSGAGLTGITATSLAIPPGMAPIPAGAFTMGEWRLVKVQNFLTQSLASWRVG